MITHKEALLIAREKMDAVQLQGVWLGGHHGARGAVYGYADLLWRLMREEAARDRVRGETDAERRRRLLKIVEERIVAEDTANWFLVLAG